ncbi:hypothetical protein ILUMI_09574, partial [Ignelater luminosus]
YDEGLWAGILGTSLHGPVFLPDRLIAEMFLHFLEETFVNLADDIPLATVHNSWFQMDEIKIGLQPIILTDKLVAMVLFCSQQKDPTRHR